MFIAWAIVALGCAGLLYGIYDFETTDDADTAPVAEDQDAGNGDLLDDPDAGQDGDQNGDQDGGDDPAGDAADDPDAPGEDAAGDDPDAPNGDDDAEAPNGDDAPPPDGDNGGDGTGQRAQNALGAEATDFIFGSDFDPDDSATMQYLVDENIDPATNQVILPDLQGNTQFEDPFAVQFLSNDSGPQTYDVATDDTYVIGSDGADDLRVSAGLVIANLGAGDDSFSDAGSTVGNQNIVVDQEVSGLATNSYGLERGIENSGTTNLIQRVFAGEGNDTIDVRGLGGLVYGDVGDDVITTGDEATYARGGAGNDIITREGTDGAAFTDFHWTFGEAGDDTIRGGNDGEILYGDSYEDRDGDGNDSIEGMAGQDIIRGGRGADTIDGGADADVIHGGTGDARMDQNPEDGGRQFAWLIDGSEDLLIAGDGDDTIWADQLDTVDLATGSSGGLDDEDLVRVAHDISADSDRVALIQGFEIDRDALEVTVDPAQFPAQALADGFTSFDLPFDLTVVDGNTQVSFGGTIVAVLEGVEVTDPLDADISVRVALDVEPDGAA